MAELLPFAALRAFEWSDTPMWVFDIAMRRMAWANPAGVTFWNAATEAELLARDFSSMSDATVTRTEATMAEHTAGRTVREQWTLYPKGTPVTVTVKSTGVALPDGRQAILFEAHAPPEGFEPAALRAVEALQHTSVRVALHRKDGTAILRNPSAVKVLGAVQEQRERDDFLAMFAERAVGEQARATVEAGETFSAEVLLATLEGQRWHGLDARPVLDPVTGETLVQVNAKDISDRKAVEHALESARAVAEAASVAKTQFLANMSHEIRTPMNGVIGMLELVLETEVSAEHRQYLETARFSAESLLALLDELLDFSKIEAGQVELECIEMDLPTIVQQVAGALATTASRKGVVLQAIVAPNVPRRLLGDPHRLRQVLLNLLGNALKFTEAGSVVVSAELLELSEVEACVELAVRDTGVGIAPEQQERIFERFVQADGSTTRKFGGTGLGLAICHRLVGLLGGTIQVQSQLGQGSCFRFVLRLQRPKSTLSNVKPAPSKNVEQRAPFGNDRLVLLAEDNPINQKVAVSMLKRLGFQFLLAENGEEALAVLAAHPAVALVLMDVQMPVMGGFDATARIREREAALGKRTPIVALTAHALEGDRARCLEAGMDDHITKPVRLGALADLLQRLLP